MKGIHEGGCAVVDEHVTCGVLFLQQRNREKTATWDFFETGRKNDYNYYDVVLLFMTS
jgi:hypothetical protein